jgi:transcriptional regulator with XRE-family HTH domain
MRSITRRFRVRRATWGLTQQDAARRAGLSLNRYWRIEQGITEPTENERLRLADALRTPVGKLFPSGSSSTDLARAHEESFR